MTSIPVILAGRLFVIPRDAYPLVAPACEYTHLDFDVVLGKRVTSARRIRLAVEEGDTVVIPTGLLPACRVEAHKNRCTLDVIETTITERPVFEPDFERLGEVTWRHRQFDVFCAVGTQPHGVIDCVTAYGKTFLIGKIAKGFPKAHVLVVVPGRQLGREVRNRLAAEIAPEGVGRLGDGHKDLDYRVIVSTPQSMDNVDADWPDIVLFDEVHNAAAAETANALLRFNRARMFGFSGSTKGRADRAEKRIEALFGNTSIEVDYEEGTEHKLITPITLRMIRCRVGDQSAAYDDDFDKIRFSIWKNRARNDRTIAELRAYRTANPGEQALILVDKTEHGLYIQQSALMMGVRIPVVCGNTGERQIRKHTRNGAFVPDSSVLIDSPREVGAFRDAFAKGEHDMAIGTAALMTGADFPRLSFVAYMSSLSGRIPLLQTAGRSMRRSPGKESAIMLDFLDLFDPPALERSNVRRREATKQGWGLEIVD